MKAEVFANRILYSSTAKEIRAWASPLVKDLTVKIKGKQYRLRQVEEMIGPGLSYTLHLPCGTEVEMSLTRKERRLFHDLHFAAETRQRAEGGTQ